MPRQQVPPREALLIPAHDIPIAGLKEGLYVVTPDMEVYEGIFQRCVRAYRARGTEIPYAIPPLPSIDETHGHGLHIVKVRHTKPRRVSAQ